MTSWQYILLLIGTILATLRALSSGDDTLTNLIKLLYIIAIVGLLMIILN